MTQYINDLSNCLSHSSANKFVDDSNITSDGTMAEEIDHKLNTGLEKIYQ